VIGNRKVPLPEKFDLAGKKLFSEWQDLEGRHRIYRRIVISVRELQNGLKKSRITCQAGFEAR